MTITDAFDCYPKRVFKFLHKARFVSARVAKIPKLINHRRALFVWITEHRDHLPVVCLVVRRGVHHLLFAQHSKLRVNEFIVEIVADAFSAAGVFCEDSAGDGRAAAIEALFLPGGDPEDVDENGETAVPEKGHAGDEGHFCPARFAGEQGFMKIMAEKIDAADFDGWGRVSRGVDSVVFFL